MNKNMTYTKAYTIDIDAPRATGGGYADAGGARGERRDGPVDIAAAQRERRERRAQALKTRRRKVKAAKAEAEKARRSFITGRRFILICVTASVVFFVGSSAFRIVELKTHEKEAIAALQTKAEQKARLESELAILNDKEYIEEQARERLGMVKPGEIIYVFEDKDSGGAGDGDADGAKDGGAETDADGGAGGDAGSGGDSGE
jgi:cell division protein FtsB